MDYSNLTAPEARQELYAIIQQDVPFEDKAREALHLGVTYLGADNGHLTRIDQATDHWEAIVSTGPPDGRFPEGLELDLETTYCRRTIKSQGQIALHDAPAQGWDDDPAFKTHGLNCYHGTTIHVDGDPYGTVCFVAEDPRREAFTDGETMFTELIARMLERELERKQHEADLTRQANLSTVLNRVLRHNLRNDMSIIRGYTQLMAEELGDNPYSTTALRNIDKLITLCEKARELDRIVAADVEREPADVVALVEDVVASVVADYPSASLSIEADEELTVAVLPSFERALEELIENAAKHGGEHATVTITVEAVPNAIEVRIADDGPGLASHEADVLETGAETPLTHGTGLGLWTAHWIITGHDGTIQATSTDDGTTMTVSVPRTPSTNVQQRRTEIERARDQYQAAFEEANDAMVIINDDAQIIDANPESAKIYGLDRQALLGRSVREFLSEGVDFEMSWREFQTAGADRDTVTIVGADGVERAVEYSAVTDIVPGQHLVVSRDITERVEREAELRFNTRAMDEAPVGITITDPNRDDNPLVYVNDRFETLAGYDAEEALGRNCRFLQGEKTDPDSVRKLRHAIDNREPVTVVLRNYRKDGTEFWNRVSVTPVEDATGELTNYVGFQEDVTERIEREQALEETTQRLEAVIDVSPDPIIAVDAERTIQLWNPAAEDVFGYSAADVIGTSISSLDLADDDHRSELEARLSRALAGETFTDVMVQRQTSDGETIYLSLSSAPIRDAEGTVTGVMVIAPEITPHIESTPAK